MKLWATIGAAFVAVVVGVLSWAGPFAFLALAFAVPLLWANAPGRWTAVLYVFLYYMGSIWPTPFAATTYFQASVLHGVTYWVVGAAVPTTPWAVLWSSSKARRAWFVPLIFCIAALPPVGIVGWAHPITAAGVVFPGWSWFGLVAGVALAAALAAFPLRIAIPTAAVLPAFAFIGTDPQPPEGWLVRETDFSFESGERDFAADYLRISAIKAELAETDAEVVVYGESLAGRWNAVGAREWGRRTTNATVLIGADLPAGEASDNVIMELSPSGDRVLYRQRLPMPVSLWRPWATTGVRAHWFSNPVVQVDGQRAAPLICYETLLVWPVVHSFAAGADTILAVSNMWCFKGTSGTTAERKAVRAWARLFDVPLVFAVNGQ